VWWGRMGDLRGRGGLNGLAVGVHVRGGLHTNHTPPTGRRSLTEPCVALISRRWLFVRPPGLVLGQVRRDRLKAS
jgi:hypothetical protein